MCNEGELLEKFNIQLAPVPMPELTDEIETGKRRADGGGRSCPVLPGAYGNLRR